MSGGEIAAWLNWQLDDLLLGSWEARHSLFAHFALYGALLATIGIVAAPLSARARAWVVVALSVASLALLGSFTMTAWALGFSIVLWTTIEYVPGRTGTGLGILCVLALGTYPWLLPETILSGNTSQMREFWAFATNVWLLRCIAYLVDRRARNTPRRTLREFLLATLFFPTFVNGPIETTEQVDAGRRPGPAVSDWTEFQQWLGLLARSSGRFLLGIAKVLFATLYLGIDNDTIFATSGTSASHPRLWLWPIELYFTFYITFSGWTDVSIALGRVLGFDVIENFDRPWRARSVAEFWRRWHISFGVWLRNYIYIPLGGNRRFATFNVLLTFLVSGSWHVWGALKVLGFTSYPPEAWSGFLIWGLANGLAVAAARFWNSSRAFDRLHALLRDRIPGALRLGTAQLLCFSFVAVAWIPFFLPPWIGLSNCWNILLRMGFLI